MWDQFCAEGAEERNEHERSGNRAYSQYPVLAEKQQFPLEGVLPEQIVGEREGSDVTVEWAASV